MTEAGRTFGDVVDAHQEEALRYLRRLTGDPDVADDLFQETFLRALPAFDQLKTGSNHRAWIYRIATNAFLNHQSSTAPEAAERSATRRRGDGHAQVTRSPAPGASDGDGVSSDCCRTAAQTANSVRPAKCTWLELFADRGRDGMHARRSPSQRLLSGPSTPTAAGRHGVMP